MARKQVARSLIDGWNVEISFAGNGVEGIGVIVKVNDIDIDIK